MIDVLGPEKRRRRTTQEKIAIVQQSFEPGMTVSLVARQHGVAASQLFLWRKQYQEGSLTAVAAGEQVVPASELAAAMKQIKELQRLLGKKTMENELLKEAVEYGRNGKQPADATLTALAGLATAADRLPYFTGADRAALATLTAIGRAIIAKGSIKDVLNYLGLGEGSALPVGVPVPWPTATPPAGWLQCNGATFTKEQYPVLARVYPTLRLPDLRGEFIRGWDGGRKVDTGRALLSFQEGTIVSGFDDNDTGDISSLGSTQYGFGDALTSNQLGVINGKKWIFDASSKGAQRYDWWAYVSARPRNIAFNYIVRAA